MFTASIPEAHYENPWLVPFEERFALLTRKKHRVAYFYHRPDNSTFRYRVYNMTQTLNEYSSHVSAAWFYTSDGARLSRVIDASDIIVVCRSPYSGFLGQFIARARKSGRLIIFDTDDMVFDTDHVELIMVTLDQDLESEPSWDAWFAYIGRIGATLRLCDRVITTNEFLADRIRRFVDKPVSIIPNFLNREQLEISDQLLARKRQSYFERDDRTHIGYFSGSPTHNKDFGIVIPALAQMLDEDPSLVVRVVGYVCVGGPLQRHQSRVEIHPFCDFVNLQRLVGSTEINIVPLQDNVFTNCKSELKYFEAAAVGTVTVASPTQVFRHAVEDGVNGYIATEYAWQDKLRAVVDSLKGKGDPYVAMAEAAREHAECRFSWTNQLSSIEQALYPAKTWQTVVPRPASR